MGNENYFKTSIFGGYKKKDVLRYVKELEENNEKLEAIRQRAEELANSVSTLLESGRLSEEAQPAVKSEPAAVQPEPVVQSQPVIQPEPLVQPAAVQPQPVVQPVIQPEPVVQPKPSFSERPKWLPENFSEEDFINLKAKAAKYEAAQNQAGGFAPLFSDSELKDRAMDIENRAWKKAELILSETERTAVKKREKADEALNSELKDTAEKFAAELKLIQDRISTLSDNFPDRLAQRMNQTKAGEEAAGDTERKNS